MLALAGCGDGGGDAQGILPGSGDDDGSSPPADSTDPNGDPHQRCVERINELRGSLDLPPLERWSDEESCSDDSAKADLEGNGAHGSFGQCGEFGQNTCPGWKGDDVIGGCLDAMWAEGPAPDPCDGQCFQSHGHYLNLTSTRFTHVACGVYTASDGTVWINMNFK